MILMQNGMCKNHTSGRVVCAPFTIKIVYIRGIIHVHVIYNVSSCIEVSHRNVDKANLFACNWPQNFLQVRWSVWWKACPSSRWNPMIKYKFLFLPNVRLKGRKNDSHENLICTHWKSQVGFGLQ